MKNKSWHISKMDARELFLAVLLVSVAVKIGFVMLFDAGPGGFPGEGSDNVFYHTTAVNWLETGVFGYERGIPTVAMPPGQSAFLALLYGMSGGSFAFARWAHILLLSLVAGLTFLTGKAFFGNAVGFAAGLLIAVDPAQAYLSITFLSEPLFIFLMCLGIYFLVRHRDREHSALTRKYPFRSRCAGVFTCQCLIGAGICFGLAGLTRNQGWLFAGFLALAAQVTRGRVIPWRSSLVVVGVASLVVLPWLVRNYYVAGSFVFIASNGGLNLWAGNNPEFEWKQPMPMSNPIYARPPNLDSHDIDQYYRTRAFKWIAAHPDQFLLNGVRKVITLYNFDPLSTRREVSMLYRLAGLFPYGLMLPFILFGLATQWRDERLWVVYAYVLFTTLLAIVFWGDSRIRAPIQPYLYLFGVLGVRQIIVWWQTSRRDVKAQLLEN